MLQENAGTQFDPAIVTLFTALLREQPELAAGLAPLEERFSGRRVIGVTSHRRENFGEGMQAIATAIRMCGQPDHSKLRLARIKNTLVAASVQFSPSLLEEAGAAHVEVTGSPQPMQFDASGRLL